MKPAIVIPLWVMRDLSAAELNQVVLHELAHLRRYDDWTNLAQQVVKAMFFDAPVKEDRLVAPFGLAASITLASVALLVLFVAVQFVLNAANPAAAGLLAFLAGK